MQENPIFGYIGQKSGKNCPCITCYENYSVDGLKPYFGHTLKKWQKVFVNTNYENFTKDAPKTINTRVNKVFYYKEVFLIDENSNF